MSALANRRGEDGAMAIVVLAIGALAVLVALAVMGLSVAAGERAKASAGADAAALAGLGALALGPVFDPCTVAGTTARENGVHLESCRVVGQTIAVVVTRVSRIPGLPAAHARARAVIDPAKLHALLGAAPPRL